MLYEDLLCSLTSMSLSLKSMTDRAFRTVFQSLLSLIELTLAQFPWRNEWKKFSKDFFSMSNINVVLFSPSIWPAPSSGSACSFSLDQASGADLLLLPPPAGRICGSFFHRGSGGPRGTSPAGNWECDRQLHHPGRERQYLTSSESWSHCICIATWLRVVSLPGGRIGYPCIFQSGLSCHSSRFWHFRMPEIWKQKMQEML